MKNPLTESLLQIESVDVSFNSAQMLRSALKCGRVEQRLMELGWGALGPLGLYQCHCDRHALWSGFVSLDVFGSTSW